MMELGVILMNTNTSLTSLFFSELKQYNSTNFKALQIKLDNQNPSVIKAYSSVVTRYFIFCEKHPELNLAERNMLYYQLKLDMIGRFFSNYPNTDVSDLVAFQRELLYYIESIGDSDE